MTNPSANKTDKSFTRRAALGALGLGAASFVAFGPRGDKSDLLASRKVVIDYWEKWTGHEGKAMQGVVDAFNASQSRIFVRYLVVSNIGQKALISIAGGSPPDVIGLWNFNIPAYAESGAILPLDQLARDAGLSLSQYKPGLHAVMTHLTGTETDASRSWFGIVNTAGTLALYCNNKLLEEVGVDHRSGLRTLGDLDRAHERLTKTNAAGALTQAGFLHLEPGWWSWIWPYSFGGSLYDSTREHALLDSPEAIAGFEWLQSYTKPTAKLRAGAIEQFRTGFGGYNTPENAFLTGKVGMVIQGPWLANMISTFAPTLDYGVVPFPVADGLFDALAPIGLVDTDVLCIPRGAKHPKEAMEFIAFTQRPEHVATLALAHAKINPLVVPIPGMERHVNRGLDVHDSIAASPRAFVVPQTRAWPIMKDNLDSLVQRFWRQEVDARSGLSQVQSLATEALARVAEDRRKRAMRS